MYLRSVDSNKSARCSIASLDLTEGKSATSEEIRSNVGREEGGESLGEIDDKRVHGRGPELGQT